MKDMLNTIYQRLISNTYIASMTKDDYGNYRIKYYIYPENGDKTGAFLTIRPVDVPNEVLHGSDTELSIQHVIQIDVEAKYRNVCKEIQFQIKKEMKNLGFGQMSGQGLDEYFEETKRFVDARRFIGNTALYDTNY